MVTSKGDKTPKVMDVSHPGKTAPSSSAKPIIVTNRPMLKQDPMMAVPDGLEQADKPKTEDVPIARTAKTINVISPLNASAAKVEPVTPAAEIKPELPPKVGVSSSDMPSLAAEPDKEKVAEEVGQEMLTSSGVAEPETTEDEKPTETPEATPDTPASSEPAKDETSTPEAEPETPTPESATPPTTDDAADEEKTDEQLAPNQALEEAKRKEQEAKAMVLAEQEKIVASKQFYLPIIHVDERRGLDRVLLVFALVLVLALVWADVVLDAGIIHIGGLHAVTHFFTK